MNSVASDLYRRTGVFADDAPHVPVKGARAPGPGADFVRMIACGSVDDGKSTLIGRLLHEAGRVPDDERAALARASASHGTRGGDIDYALLLDGLDAEREQGITIDVAWRHLETKRRRFLIADCPGHVQYTRNMATGASVADLAVVLVDATRGLLPQTVRESWRWRLLWLRAAITAELRQTGGAMSDRLDGFFEELTAIYHADQAERPVCPPSRRAWRRLA